MLLINIISFLFTFLIGLVIGSFLTAYTYRAPLGLSISKGRSFCPKCKKTIHWYDNIPVISYLLLGGKCRNCGKKIPKRYPTIELTTGLIFVVIAYFAYSCFSGITGISICTYWSSLGVNSVPFLFIVSTIFIAVFVTDYEHQVILDEFIFILLVVAFFATVFYTPDLLFERTLAGLLAALFLLFLHIITKGRGMGLGDVKLALAGGFVLGWPTTLVWMVLSFIIGAVVGLLLIVAKRTKFGKQIAFGPFLVISFFIAMFFGDQIISLLKI